MKFLDACLWLVESANRGAGWSLFLLLTVALSFGPAKAVGAAQPTDTPSQRIEGSVFRQTVQGTRPIRDGVILIDDVESRGSNQRNQPSLMNQIHTTFQPHILPVQVGQPIRFLNSDSQLHNVRLNPDNSRG